MKKVILCVAMISIMSMAAQAGYTIVDLPATGTDAAIGIDSNKTYTHTFDFGTYAGSPVTVNGVDFDQAFSTNRIATFNGTSKWGYDYTIADTRASTDIRVNAGSTYVDGQADGQSRLLLRDMVYHSSSRLNQGIVITLSELTAGTSYSTRVYYRDWDNRAADIRTITVQGDGGHHGVFSDVLDVEWDGGGAHYLDYSFTADDADVTLKFLSNDKESTDPTKPNYNGVHMYGLSNEVVPEPATLVLLGMGGLALLKRRRA